MFRAGAYRLKIISALSRDYDLVWASEFRVPWPDLFLALGVIAISAEPKKGLVNYLFYCHYSGSTNQIAVFKLIEFLARNVTE